MAGTPEQKAASRAIMDAVTALNKALNLASGVSLFVQLGTVNTISDINPNYTVSKIETRETVLP